MDGGAALGKELLDISASMIQSVWRAGQVNITRHEWHGGWLWKTASGGGPVENLRGAWSSLDANAVSAIPNVAELAPTVRRRWFVLAPKKGTSPFTRATKTARAPSRQGAGESLERVHHHAARVAIGRTRRPRVDAARCHRLARAATPLATLPLGKHGGRTRTGLRRPRG